jgi:hypothetical protein
LHFRKDVTSIEVNFRTFWFVMKNCRNKNGLPMKGIEMKPFHGGQNEYLYSDIGMGGHNLEFFVRLYSTDCSALYPWCWAAPAQLQRTPHLPSLRQRESCWARGIKAGWFIRARQCPASFATVLGDEPQLFEILRL